MRLSAVAGVALSGVLCATLPEGGFAQGSAGECVQEPNGESSKHRQCWDGGKRRGRWVIRFSGGEVREGSYVAGKKQGHWVIRLPDGGVQEGPYVAGEKQGHWVLRYADGTVEEGPAVAGLREGRWAVLRPDGSRRAFEMDGARTRYGDANAARGGQRAPAVLALLQGMTLVEAAEEAERRERLRPGRVFRDCPECPELVVVPSGSFMMGSPSSESGRDDDEGPVHRVTIGYPFAVGVYEVTFGEWDACVSGGGCGGHRPDDRGWGRGRRPVMNVNWDDAQGYVEWLSRKTGEEYRLLSEAEWEHVARAGTKTARYWGESESGQCRYANGADREAKRHNSGWTVADCDDGHYRTAPVGSFQANGYKLHDVLGNVWEWTEDCWNWSYAGAPRDGGAWESGECGRRVLRGGSWSNEPRYLRSAYRLRDISRGLRDSSAGFRVARTLRRRSRRPQGAAGRARERPGAVMTSEGPTVPPAPLWRGRGGGTSTGAERC